MHQRQRRARLGAGDWRTWRAVVRGRRRDRRARPHRRLLRGRERGRRCRRSRPPRRDAAASRRRAGCCTSAAARLPAISSAHFARPVFAVERSRALRGPPGLGAERCRRRCIRRRRRSMSRCFFHRARRRSLPGSPKPPASGKPVQPSWRSRSAPPPTPHSARCGGRNAGSPNDRRRTALLDLARSCPRRAAELERQENAMSEERTVEAAEDRTAELVSPEPIAGAARGSRRPPATPAAHGHQRRSAWLAVLLAGDRRGAAVAVLGAGGDAVAAVGRTARTASKTSPPSLHG